MAAMGREGIFVTWVVAMAIGIGIGAVIPGVLAGSTGGEPLNREAAGSAPTASAASSRPGVTSGLPDFRAVVKLVVPSVVTVRSQRTVEMSRAPSPFLDPFEEFFGPGQGQRRREPRSERFIQRGLG